MSSASDDAQQEAQNLELRKALSDAYAAIEGAKATQTFVALTFEECCQQQITDISGPDTPSRPNQLNSVAQVLAAVTQAAAKIKAMPDDAFNNPDSSTDVNSPVDGTSTA